MRLPVLLTSVAVLAGSIACNSGRRGTVEPDSVRVARALTGLRPPIEVEGRAPVRWSLTERMAHYQAPGVSIAVIAGGRVAWAGGFGVKVAGGNDPVTPTTLFQAASISKPVAATGMLRLVADGRLDLDTDVNQYLTSWRVPENRHTGTEKVTLRRLVSHSAGLTVHGFPGYRADSTLPTTVQILDGVRPANTAAVRVDTTPGAIWRYSGGGTTVQQLLLSDVTGESFPVLLKRLVLDPAGMTSSTYEQPLPEGRRGDAAHAHTGDGTMVPGHWHSYPEMAAAGLWTTPTDLARWALAVAAARAGTDTTLLPQALAAEMLTVQKGNFGLGPTVQGSGPAFRFGHGGSNAGFRSVLTYYPEAGVGAAVMVNSDNGDDLQEEILLALAAEYGWPELSPRRITAVPLDSASLAAAAGQYLMRFNRDTIPLSVTLEDGVLRSKLPFFPAAEELVPVGPGAFVGLARGWRFELGPDSAVVVVDENLRIRGARR